MCKWNKWTDYLYELLKEIGEHYFVNVCRRRRN